MPSRPRLGPGHFASSLGESLGQGPFFDPSRFRCNMGQGAEGNALTFLTCPMAAVSGPGLSVTPLSQMSYLLWDSVVVQISPTLLTHSIHFARFREPS